MKDNAGNGGDVENVLREEFYHAPSDPPPARARSSRSPGKKAEHYEVICISMYLEDLARLDAKVLALKKAGHRKMSRSALIRFALDTVDLAKLPRSY